MPAWIEQISASNSFVYGANIIAVLIVVILVLVIVRLAFGHRLRLPGTKSRLPRLGLIDAFSLDSRRQLVIIRRDNVEHLILIGGPNDLLIEPEIIRAETRDGRESRAREREVREKEFRETVPSLAPNGLPRGATLPASSIPGSFIPAANSIAEPSSEPASPLPQPLAAKPPTLNVQVPPVQAASQPERSSVRPAGQNASNAVPGMGLPQARAGFVATPRLNPFPIPPRRAPVTTPLPKTPSLREPILVPQGEPRPPRKEAEAKGELSNNPPPAAVNRGSLTASPMRPLQRSWTPPQVSTSSPDRQEKSVTPELAQLSSLPLELPVASPEALATTPTEPPQPEVKEEAFEPTSPNAVEKPLELTASESNAAKVEPEAAAKPAEPADMLQSLEEEMAKLLGRE